MAMNEHEELEIRLGNDIDKALRYLHKHSSGRPHSIPEIANACGCCNKNIQKILASAIQKIRVQMDEDELREIVYYLDNID